MNIHVGDEIELTEEVVPENTAEKWGSGSLPVYATPAMISLIEQSAVNLLAGKLEEGQTTVGTNLNIAHVSATPVGGTIKCHCSLTEIDRKRAGILIPTPFSYLLICLFPLRLEKSSCR